jgi:hypothetical protein
LAGTFAATFFARSTGLRQQMAKLWKRVMTMTVYFTKMKALTDELTSIGQPLRELISYILAVSWFCQQICHGYRCMAVCGGG